MISSIGTSVHPENFESIPTECMIEPGWTPIQVKQITSETESVNYTTISRWSQYPFNPQNGLTMYTIIGDSLQKGVTQVDDDKNSDYYIWERGDTVVLLLRFSNISDLIFVSPKGPEATIQVWMDTLDKRDEVLPLRQRNYSKTIHCFWRNVLRSSYNLRSTVYASDWHNGVLEIKWTIALNLNVSNINSPFDSLSRIALSICRTRPLLR